MAVPKIKRERSFGGKNPNIIRAAYFNNIAEAEAALVRNPNCISEVSKRNQTALHIASLSGNFHMVSFLLGQPGVDLTICDDWGRDVIDAAIIAGDQRIVDALFRYNALN